MCHVVSGESCWRTSGICSVLLGAVGLSLLPVWVTAKSRAWPLKSWGLRQKATQKCFPFSMKDRSADARNVVTRCSKNLWFPSLFPSEIMSSLPSHNSPMLCCQVATGCHEYTVDIIYIYMFHDQSGTFSEFVEGSDYKEESSTTVLTQRIHNERGCRHALVLIYSWT